METPGLTIDNHGRINHQLAHKLPSEELLDVCQLRGCPLPANLSDEVKRRGLLTPLADLLERQRLAPNN